ncbi:MULTISPECIES: hypothetical protein [Pseudoalteromonas]|nr:MULTISPECIES: hypothetical protein [Pseudoalteromonas]MDP4487155.1 hypothetical protein [Pseudoalteromonas piscicida]WPU33183.1 hypothetical protein SIO17_05505 [Pseudoalteromonas piscicida]
MMKPLSRNLAALGFLVTSSVAYADYTAELEIDRMQDTPFKECSDYTFRQVMNNFFTELTWDYLTSDWGRNYINIDGYVEEEGEKFDFLLQYEVKSDGTFEFNAMEFLGKAKDDSFIIMMLDKICYHSTGD